MANEVVIPMLPCSSIQDTLDFYRALGFEVTFEQSQQNTYASVKHNDIQLHFFVKRDWNPAFCYIKVSDVDGLHRAFVDRIKETYGKRLSKGTPRITSVNTLSTDRRFNVVDPSSNWLYIGQPLATSEIKGGDGHGGVTRLAKTVGNARTFAYSKDDARGAARILDVAFAKNEVVPATVQFRALVLRADVALMLDDPQRAQSSLSEARRILLGDAERETLRDELRRMGELGAELEDG